MKFKIFISSVQNEFADARAKLVKYIREDALLGRFFDPFIFEETPACDWATQQVYLDEVESCDVYVGILGERFGNEVRPGVSATECEYDRATELGKSRLLFVLETSHREDRETAFVDKIERTVTRKSFCNYDDLKTAVYGALVRHLELSGDFKTIIWRKGYGAHQGAHEGASVAPVGAPVAPVGAPVRTNDAQEHACRFFDLPSGHSGTILTWLWDGAISREEMASRLGIIKKARSLRLAIELLMTDGLIEYTIPDRPRHVKQQYRLSEKGRAMMKSHLRKQ